MDSKKYAEDFIELLAQAMQDEDNNEALERAYRLIHQTRKEGKKIMLIGNGGSAAIAEHMAIDLTKNAKMRAIAFSGSPQLTTYANDYGYEYVFSKALEAQADPGDVLVAISSSGRSKNILNAVDAAKKMGCSVITLSAFDPDNPLKARGDVNLFVDSLAYGYVETVHHLMIHYMSDRIIGSTEYRIT